MHIASALSTLSSVPALAQDIEGQLKANLPGAPDLLLVFVSYTLVESFEPIVTMLRTGMQPRHLLAVAAESILGTDQEIERSAAVSALAISSPAAALHTFHMAEDEWQDLLTDRDLLEERVTPTGDTEGLRAFFLFADPFTTPVVQLLEVCSQVFSQAPVLGGMASGMKNAGDTRLALNGAIHTSGTVGVSFSGPIEIDCVVSQGCRPIGDTFVVTKCHQNVIEQLGGKPALTAVEEMVMHLPLHDKQLVATGGLQIGRIIDQGKGNYGHGDFLIRSLIGVRRETGAILVGDMMKPGETLQFHVRDAKTADEEMRLLLEGESLLAPSTAQPAGALLITCNGRGTRMFDMPHHDISLTRQVLGSIPVAGFFAAGEMGPVGERNFIHGHTAALAVFREASPAS
jgi:small ligand-binding sensory domain FIST